MASKQTATASCKSWKDSFGFRALLKSQESSSSTSTSSTTSLENSTEQQLAKNVAIAQDSKIVTALFKYKAVDKSEISFKKGDRLLILGDYASGWWTACKTGESEKSGCIPKNYVAVDLSNKEWYFASTSRHEANRLLMESPAVQGSFLIRKSDHEPDDYILSVRILDSVKHFSIQVKPNGDYYINFERPFARLDDLIAYYSSIDTLEISFQRLTKPLPGKPAPAAQTTAETSEIKPKRLEFNRELVWLSTDKSHVYSGLYKKVKVKSTVAIKTLEPGSMLTVSAFFHEADIMRPLKHPHILSLVGVSTSKRPLIVTEFMAKGDLLTYLRDSSEAESLMLNNLLCMASQITSAMAYLEHQQIVHRCLMARNCLVGANNTVKVGNFSQARKLEGNIYTENRASSLFPIKWTAPEALSGIFSIKSDVWSYGILLYEIITKGMVPYPGFNVADVVEQLEKGTRMAKPVNVNCPEPIYQVMCDCWHWKPEKRPEFKYLYCYFDNFCCSDVQNESESLAEDCNGLREMPP